MFAKSQALKKPNGVKSSTDAQVMILKQRQVRVITSDDCKICSINLYSHREIVNAVGRKTVNSGPAIMLAAVTMRRNLILHNSSIPFSSDLKDILHGDTHSNDANSSNKGTKGILLEFNLSTSRNNATVHTDLGNQKCLLPKTNRLE
ncbi:unnamed protein product [Dovyalis caffra]|uniref:Uncharacterized protein n=1 Tax=Dovyalis caffra TaxID=77055 RepID=A0AAV1RI43_9ROSI|nr:unnamed protein product [Dovyalis caffra]